MPDLPPIVEEATLDATGYVAALQAMAAAARAAADAQARLLAGLAATQRLMDSMAAGAAVAAVAEGRLAEADTSAAEAAAAAAAAAALAANAEREEAAAASTAAAAEDAAAAAAARLAAANTAAGASAFDAAAGAAAQGRAWAINIGWMRLTATALHWIVAGTAEFLAVAVPAAVALGAGMAVAAQGAQNVYLHMQAVFKATEATRLVFGKTTGDVLGLGHALQTAQNAADPGVYTLLGAAINSARASTTSFAQAGLQVVHMLDEFAARVTVDMQGAMGAQIHGLLSQMVSDLQMFGQVLANLGHALLNFASAMPGLARALLAIADAISRVILAISSLPAPLIMAAIAMEELYRWGGLVMTTLVRLTGQMGVMNAMGATNFFTRFGAALSTLISAGGRALIWAGTVVARFAGVTAAAGTMGTALANAGSKIALFAESMGPAAMAGWAGGIAVAAAAVGFLIYKISTAKDATQQWVAAQDQLIAKASDLSVLPTIYNSMAQTIAKLGTQSQYAGQLQTQFNRAAFAAGPALTAAAQDSATLSNHLMGVWQQAQHVVGNAQNLASVLHVSVPAAMIAAQQAGVNLQSSMAKGSQAFAIAAQQIRNYFTGLGAMGAPAGQLGADVMALGIQSQLASSKVGQLNSAWDAWISSVTGGVAAMAQVETAMAGMSSAVAGTSALISGAIPRIERSVQGSSYTLRGFGQAAMQSWQQFTSAIGTGNTALDSMRTGMAEGVVSNQQYMATVRGLVGQMAPFTQGNRAAVSMLSQLAHEAGGPVTTSLKTLEQWAGVTGRTARNQFASGMLAASIAMGNMSKVALNLSAVVSGQLDQSMAAAIVQSSGLNSAMKTYAQDLSHAGTPARTLATALQNIEFAMQKANTMTGQAAKGLNAASKQADAAAQSAARAAKGADAVGTASQLTAPKIAAMNAQAANSAKAMDNMGKVGTTAVTQLVQGITSAAPRAGAAVTSMAQLMQVKVAVLPGKMTTAGHDAAQGLATGVTSASGRAVAATAAMTTQMQARTAAMAAPFRSAGYNASLGAAAGIMAGMGAAVAAATAVANAASAAFAAHLRVHSPSALTYQYGLWVAQGLANGITAGTPLAVAAMRAMAGAVMAGWAAARVPGFGGVTGGAYSPQPLVPAGIGVGGGGMNVTSVTVPVQVQGHVLTDQQLGDFIRASVQTYLKYNADTGFNRRGRSS